LIQLTGLYSGIVGPGSLGLAAPSDIFAPSQTQVLLSRAEANIDHYATVFSNGNPGLAEAIRTQHKFLIELYRKNEALPLEMNIVPGYQGPLGVADRPVRNFTTIS